MRDFITDFDARQIPFETKFQIRGWGRIHEGWADGVAVVLGKIAEALKKHDDGTQALWITGHSLGGALAMVTAAILANMQSHRLSGIYTFGQPRVGDLEFRSRYDQELRAITFRCVNNCDLVPHLPPREMTKLELGWQTRPEGQSRNWPSPSFIGRRHRTVMNTQVNCVSCLQVARLAIAQRRRRPGSRHFSRTPEGRAACSSTCHSYLSSHPTCSRIMRRLLRIT